MHPQPDADVTVIIPALDRAEVLQRAIDSVRAQSIGARYLIVVDDGSTDATAEIARSTGATVIHHEEPQGSAEARNSGIEAASTEWLAFLDSDDAWRPGHLAALLAASDGVDMVCSAVVDDFGRARGDLGGKRRELHPQDLFFPENLVSTSGVLLRTSVAKRLGGFRHVERAEDLDLWVRVIEAGRAVCIPDVSVLYSQPTRYPEADLHRRNLGGARHVIDSFSGERWNTPRLRSRVATRERWDELRFALHADRSPIDALRLVGLALDPRRAGALARVLKYRRRARRVGTQALAEFAEH